MNIGSTSYIQPKMEGYRVQNLNPGKGFTELLTSMHVSNELHQSSKTVAQNQIEHMDAISQIIAASVIMNEDAPMEAYLDTYKNIYAKYAAIYGDGFEIKNNIIIYGNKESEEAGKRNMQIKESFYNELASAIPQKYLVHKQPLTVVELEEIRKNRPDNVREMIENSYCSDTVDKLFYEDKYNLTGLSPEEKISSMIERYGKGSMSEFNIAISVLYKTSALTGGEYMSATVMSTIHALNDKMNNYSAGNSDFDEALNKYYTNMLKLIRNAEATEYDWAEVFLQKIGQGADRYEAVYAKLFGGTTL